MPKSSITITWWLLFYFFAAYIAYAYIKFTQHTAVSFNSTMVQSTSYLVACHKVKGCLLLSLRLPGQSL